MGDNVSFTGQKKRPNQHQSRPTEGKDATKVNPEKANNTKYNSTIKRDTYYPYNNNIW